MNLHPISPPPARAGYTFVEVLVALFILSIGMLGIGVLATQATMWGGLTTARSQAISQAQLQLDEIRLGEFDDWWERTKGHGDDAYEEEVIEGITRLLRVSRERCDGSTPRLKIEILCRWEGRSAPFEYRLTTWWTHVPLR